MAIWKVGYALQRWIAYSNICKIHKAVITNICTIEKDPENTCTEEIDETCNIRFKYY